MTEYGLLGRHLRHSYSPRIHTELGNYPYTLYEVEPDRLADFLQNGSFKGLNVTIPYKKTVIPYLDALSPAAQRLGAVNTVIRREDGKLVGYNTDYSGFSSMVSLSGLQLAGKKVLVLGSGGASGTAVAVLEELGAHPVVISRSGDHNYQNLHRHADASVIVNATPVGMYPSTGISPIDLGRFPDLEGVLDMIYNPARTQLLMEAERRGITAVNGLWMLIAQAKESAELFTGSKIQDGVISQIYEKLRRQAENIILVGMPGCGKTTVASIMAQKLGRTLADSDSCIEKEAGIMIPEIFSRDGEEVFRRLETQVLARLGRESSLVIATGGGCVTREENYPLLHQNGRIIWLTRAIETLPTDGRPISQTNNLLQLYERRSPLYLRFADLTVNNDGTPEETADAILQLLSRNGE